MDLTSGYGGRPTIGALMTLCEENYLALLRLAPELPRLRGSFVSRRGEGADLLLDVGEQAPFTTALRLTHLFAGTGERSAWRAEPDARLRAYHDARQVEVLGLRQTALPLLGDYKPPALAAKWKANFFIAKWLGYCLAQGHRFPAVVVHHTERRDRDPLPAS